MILNEIDLTGHGNNTYCRANKSCICKWYHVGVILNEIDAVAHGSRAYRKANKGYIWE